MSSTEPNALPQTAAQEGALTPSETRKLNFLGYNKTDIAALTPDVARGYLLTSTRKAPKALSKRSTKQAVADGNAKRIRESKACATPPTAQVAAPEPAPLTEAEVVALDLLGWQTDHIAGIPLPQVRAIISARTPRPGSRAFNAASPTPIPDRYTDEAIKEANVTRQVASGVEVRVDEYTHKLVRGDDPLDALINQCQDAYPDDVIRLINPELPQPAGQQFQQIYATDGTKLGAADLLAMRMPKKVYEEAYVKPNLKRSQQMMGDVERGRVGEDTDIALNPADRAYAPVQGKGLTIAPQLANL